MLKAYKQIPLEHFTDTSMALTFYTNATLNKCLHKRPWEASEERGCIHLGIVVLLPWIIFIYKTSRHNFCAFRIQKPKYNILFFPLQLSEVYMHPWHPGDMQNHVCHLFLSVMRQKSRKSLKCLAHLKISATVFSFTMLEWWCQKDNKIIEN